MCDGDGNVTRSFHCLFVRGPVADSAAVAAALPDDIRSDARSVLRVLLRELGRYSHAVSAVFGMKRQKQGALTGRISFKVSGALRADGQSSNGGTVGVTLVAAAPILLDA